jgi:hypothetical protein
MKMRCLVAMILFLCARMPFAAADPLVSDLSLHGVIEGENVAFELAFTVETERDDDVLTLVDGEVAYLSADLPRGVELHRRGAALQLRLEREGRHRVAFTFASKPRKDGEWRHTSFSLPSANVRELVMDFEREDLEVQFPGALSVKRERAAEGGTRVTAFLGAGDCFHVRWKPEVKRLSAEVAVSCEAITVATAGVGALRQETVFTYRVVQGSLQDLSLTLPPGLNVTQVEGGDILQWTIEPGADGARLLEVTLNRPQEQDYRLQVVSEYILPAFPAEFGLPLVVPRDVIRTSGFLLLGAAGAINLQVTRATGLTQIDQDAFPAPSAPASGPRAMPSRSVFAYQFANLPFALDLAARDVVSAYDSQGRIVFAVEDENVSLDASLQIDVRDAPVRELTLITETEWVVARVEGEAISEFDVREGNGRRRVVVHFGEAVLGRALIHVRLERTLAPQQDRVVVPGVEVEGAQSERGFVVLAGEAGVRLKPEGTAHLRPIPTGSLPFQVSDAQHAFRYKQPDWSLAVVLETTRPTVHSELFHLISLGEGALYGSCTVTYHIGSAPVRSLDLALPPGLQNVDFAGLHLRGWQREGDTWTLTLQERTLGDYTLLVTYDQAFAFEGDEIEVGGIQTLGTDSEVGFVAVSGAADLKVEEERSLDPALLPIGREEIPAEYALLINDPVLRAYKYMQVPHAARLKVAPFTTKPLPAQVTDHVALDTRISADGEQVTTARYFVKNRAGQFFAAALPEGARLWSAEVDGEKVQPLEDPQGEGGVLIPLPRHRDPNRPSRVELVYAAARRPCIGRHLFTRYRHFGPSSVLSACLAAARGGSS